VSALEELRDAGAEAIILDLRNNPGGFLNTAIDVASEFIDGGVVVYQEDARGRRTPMEAARGGRATDVPLVVLVNRGSASASEIVAGAIRDRDRGVLVGQTTFGKGSVQNVHNLSDGSELRVTVAVWLTPDGTLIHKTGIEPDILVEPAPPPDPEAEPTEGAEGDAAEAPDPQLDRAIEEALRLLEAR
jgi:carboxyl-terminal processing protease